MSNLVLCPTSSFLFLRLTSSETSSTSIIRSTDMRKVTIVNTTRNDFDPVGLYRLDTYVLIAECSVSAAITQPIDNSKKKALSKRVGEQDSMEEMGFDMSHRE